MQRFGLGEGLARPPSLERRWDLPQQPLCVARLRSVAWRCVSDHLIAAGMAFAPSGATMPNAEHGLLDAALQAMSDPALLKTGGGQGLKPYPSDQRSPAATREILRFDVARWVKVIRDNDIEVEQ